MGEEKRGVYVFMCVVVVVVVVVVVGDEVKPYAACTTPPQESTQGRHKYHHVSLQGTHFKALQFYHHQTIKCRSSSLVTAAPQILPSHTAECQAKSHDEYSKIKNNLNNNNFPKLTM
ncbi:hypothetical protein E2C01_072612 [Portunus trituberculatus]|uniref:Uncharacterized protein n=1 Tax=Portunus trituberculatus TaxID=210409 RepID=A0A5B7I311_PORTR|nr:hypothetical protein [Portunus trituberculatus]